MRINSYKYDNWTFIPFFVDFQSFAAFTSFLVSGNTVSPLTSFVLAAISKYMPASHLSDLFMQPSTVNLSLRSCTMKMIWVVIIYQMSSAVGYPGCK